MKPLGTTPQELLAYYRSFGFEVRGSDPEAPGDPAWTDEELLAFCRAKDGTGHATLVLTRS